MSRYLFQPLIKSAGCLALVLAIVPDAAQATTLGTSIHDVRSPRVGLALPGMWAGEAFKTSYFDHPVPAAPTQDEIVLRPDDQVALHLPMRDQSDGFMGSYHINRMPQVDLASRRVTFDLYHRPHGQNFGALWIDMQAVENSYWIGSLPAGEYEMEVRNWKFPLPPCDYQSAIRGGCGRPAIDFNDAELTRTRAWNFTVVPEPTTQLLAAFAGIAGFLSRRFAWIG